MQIRPIGIYRLSMRRIFAGRTSIQLVIEAMHHGPTESKELILGAAS